MRILSKGHQVISLSFVDEFIVKKGAKTKCMCLIVVGSYLLSLGIQAGLRGRGMSVSGTTGWFYGVTFYRSLGR